MPARAREEQNGADVHSLRRARAVAMAAALLALAACSDQSPSTLDPAGPGARRIETFWWIIFWISTAVCVVVFVGVAWALIRRRRKEPVSNRDPTKFVLVAGAVLPFVVLAAMYGLSMRDTLTLSRPYSAEAPLTIEVIGHQWWWEVRYPPGSQVVTANEIHIPTDTDVALQLSTADVLHSFWVPQLMPKTDLIAGRTNTTWLRADEPGTYRGQCAEYCGVQHAHMAFMVVAHPRAEFDEWLREADNPVPPDTPTERRGLAVFTQSTCASCHTISGTTADGTVGPNLTTVGGRWSLGAGSLPNGPDHMRDWIANPQQAKPGNAMPPQPVPPSDMDDLVAYLQSLTPNVQGPQ